MKKIIIILTITHINLLVFSQILTAEYRNNNYYGMMQNNKQNGLGCYIGNGSYFRIGEYKEGRLNGEGFNSLVKNNTNYIYYGDWVDGQKDGYFYIVSYSLDNLYFSQQYFNRSMEAKNSHKKKEYASGATWHGVALDNNGNPSGIGIMTYSNGKKYFGQWKSGKYCGTGIYIWKNTEDMWHNRSLKVFYSNWKNNKRNGVGIYIDYNEDRGKSVTLYRGNYKDDKRNGWGALLWGNPDKTYYKYVGYFKDGREHGNGKLYENGVLQKSGKWENGNYVEPEAQYTTNTQSKIKLNSTIYWKYSFPKRIHDGCRVITFRVTDISSQKVELTPISYRYRDHKILYDFTEDINTDDGYFHIYSGVPQWFQKSFYYKYLTTYKPACD